MPTIAAAPSTVAQALERVRALNFPHLGPPPDVAGLVGWQRLPAGRTLFAQGAPSRALYAVVTGEVACRITAEDGSSSVLEHVTPGGLFGLSGFAAGLPTRYEAVATCATQVLCIGPQAYGHLLDAWPGLARALIEALARRFDQNLLWLDQARHRRADDRLRSALAQLRRERARPDPERPGGWVLAATQSELAQLAGVSRQTANAWLQGQGIELGYRRLRGEAP
ncbi:MAG: Crp/Fnr family transcriptional regulator [Inhella sp.]|uniref:Crp/Fnr family transcriptional regulator n=1 Tax=Inhella sp. TaxID=1921806 RepID=UPI0022BC306D|nr:Crp/Fnr family transcriptional regulator [Inhella sp.]MCZ8236013.1 Crp/Fnr family transcriptional regulator [Inhella sp.]